MDAWPELEGPGPGKPGCGRGAEATGRRLASVAAKAVGGTREFSIVYEQLPPWPIVKELTLETGIVLPIRRRCTAFHGVAP